MALTDSPFTEWPGAYRSVAPGIVPRAATKRSTSAVVNGSRFTRMVESDALPPPGEVATRMWREGSGIPRSPSA